MIHFDVHVRLFCECCLESQAVLHENLLRPFLISRKTDRDQMQTGGDIDVTTGIPIEHSVDFDIGAIRLTNAYSKKPENFKAAIGLYFGYHNFVKIYTTLRTTPAMAAGVVSELRTVADLVEKRNS